MAFKKAIREKLPARVGICGSSGSGKTHSALRLAKGLANGGRIMYICTEQGSAKLEAGKPGIPEFEIAVLEKPYTPQRYMALIDEAVKENPAVIIIDSLSHAWSGQGGVLEMVDRVKSGGNNFTAWRELTPLHNKFVEHILTIPCHVICTMRTKTEWVTEKNEQGRMTPKKIGLSPVQRDGMEYEFTVVFDIDRDKHLATASKDRTSLFDESFGDLITDQHGVRLREWLDAGSLVQEIKTEPVIKELLTTSAKNRLNILAKESGFKDLTHALNELDFGVLDTMDDGAKLAEILKTRKAS